MKTIAFIMQESRMGGIEYNSVHLAKALQGQTDIVFIIPGPGPLMERLTQEKIPFIVSSRPPFFSTSMPLGKYFIFNPAATFYNFLLFPFLSFKLFRVLKRNEFDLAVTKGLLCNFYGALAASFARIQCVWDMQEIVSKTKVFGLLSWSLNWWAKIFASAVIVSSQAIAAQFWGTTQNKVKIIPNGIDTDYYHPEVNPSPVRKEWGIAEKQILIVHIARFTYWKGQKDFVKAGALLRRKRTNIKFALVGSPVFENEHYEKEVKQLADEMGLSPVTIFPGFRDDLVNILAAADIFVHSSIEPEGCPITLITAMGMGKACVVTNVEGNNEIINEAGKQALLIQAGNPEEMADAIDAILKDPDLHKRLTVSARSRIVQRYSLKAYSEQSRRLFEEVLS